MATTGHVKWTGGLRSGGGVIDTGSGAVSGLEYSAATRFGDGKGTNPEELLGAAHAACYSTALTLFLGTVPGISDEDFQEQANNAKEQCPVSKALASVPKVTLDAKLAS